MPVLINLLIKYSCVTAWFVDWIVYILCIYDGCNYTCQFSIHAMIVIFDIYLTSNYSIVLHLTAHYVL